MSPAEVLTAAADLLERDGWQQHRVGPRVHWRFGARCATGAIVAAADCDPMLESRDAHDACDALSAHLGGATVVFWNDEQGRTQAEVIEALRRAAA